MLEYLNCCYSYFIKSIDKTDVEMYVIDDNLQKKNDQFLISCQIPSIGPHLVENNTPSNIIDSVDDNILENDDNISECSDIDAYKWTDIEI